MLFSHPNLMKNGVGRGAIVLIVSGFICKLFGAMFRLPLTNIIGIDGIGAFQMVMSLYSLMLVLTTGGVTTSLSKLVSQSRARGENGKIRGYLRISLYFSVGLSLVIGGVFFIFARSIASTQGIGANYISYRLILPLLILGSLIGCMRGVIQGYENMIPTAISQILEQIIKFAFGLLFAMLLGSRGMGVFGAFIGITLSEILAGGYLILYMLTKMKLSKYDSSFVIKPFFTAVVPLSLAGGVLPLTHAIDSLVIVGRLAIAGIGAEVATSLYGLQTGVVGAILNFPLIISLSVAMALLPKISFLSGKGDLEGQKSTISTSFSLLWLFLLPLVFGIMAVSPLLYPIIYPSAIKGYLSQAISLTMIGGVSIILSAIMQFLLSILQAKGYYTYSFIVTFVGGLAKVLIVIFTAFLPEVNIFALPLSNIVLALIVCILSMIKLGGLVKVGAFEFFTPLLASLVMFMVVWIFIRTLELSSIVMLLLSVILGGITYILLCLPIIKSLITVYLGKHLKREEKNE